MKVAKFGGSSVADAGQFKKVKQIVESDAKRRIVVVSAVGKSVAEPIKVTDMLLDLEQKLVADEDPEPIFQAISSRIIGIRDDLNLNVNIEADLAIIADNLANCSHDYLISRGEYLTAKLMAAYLGYYFVDAKDILIFANDGIDYVQSQQRLLKVLSKHSQLVIPGFYGANVDGSVHLMPRGGSDISGSILANLVDAELYENWTDVSGILMADPRIVAHSEKIDSLTYDELQELSYMGIGVFQEEAVRPVREKKIPTAVLNTNHPEAGGTMVVSADEDKNNDHIVTGIAGRKDCTVITIRKYQLNKHLEVLQNVLSVFQKFNLTISSVPSGNDGFSFLCQHGEVATHLPALIAKLKHTCGIDSVEVNQNIALVAAVSLQLSRRPAIAGKIMNYLDNSLIHVRFVFQEGSDLKIVFGVNNDDYEKTIKRIYRESMEQHLKRISA